MTWTTSATSPAAAPSRACGSTPAPATTSSSRDFGQDYVTLGDGDDWYDGGYGSDTAYGGGGKDTMIGGSSFNVLHGGDGNDTVMSGSWIGTGSSLYGDNGNDYLQGGWANDNLLGGPGDDQLDGGRGGDLHNGGPGFDTVDYDSRTGVVAVTFNGVADDGNAAYDDGFGDDLDNVAASIEKAIGGQANDTMIAGSLPVVLAGGPGNDWLTGGPEADTLLGQDGWDVMRGGFGADTLDGGLGTDEIRYDERSARVAVRLDGLRNDGADPNSSNSSGATEEGDRDIAVERVRSGSAGDYLQGNAAVNLLVGNGGNDDIKSRDGTAGVDVVNCGDGTDRFDEDAPDSTFNCETPFTFP